MSDETTVVNLQEEPYDEYIGRGSIWGNPFHIGQDGTRMDVIRKYREYLLEHKGLMKLLPTLKGKKLGCFCKPQACHGDVLVEMVELELYDSD